MSPKPITQNTMFYVDNLPILRQHIPTESADLICLDPPFNSNSSSSVLFKDEGGKQSESQLTAFDDTCHWREQAEDTYGELATQAPTDVGKMIAALRGFVGSVLLDQADVWEIDWRYFSRESMRHLLEPGPLLCAEATPFRLAPIHCRDHSRPMRAGVIWTADSCGCPNDPNHYDGDDVSH